jgi:polyhydroxyalkanoate synthesis repressor PhaR
VKGGKEKSIPTTRIVKRYRNRKLYDINTSSYVTLSGVMDMVKSGHEVRVIDHETGQDITSVTLAQIILETERRGFRFINLGIVKKIFDFFSNSNISKLGGDVEKSILSLVKKGEISRDDGMRILQEVQEVSLTSRTNFDAIKSGIDERLSEFVSRFLSILKLGDLRWVLTQLKEMRKKLSELEEKVKILEGTLPQVSPPEEEVGGSEIQSGTEPYSRKQKR